MHYRVSVSAIVLFSAVLAFYVPGLSGGFLLDDFHTLEPLGANRGINSLSSLAEYVFSGTTGPTGRPVSLITFALNAQNWPTDPLPFLATNIVIHALNTTLIFVFMLGLFRYKRDAKTLWFSFACALLWGLHPIQVSSVLYVVQRMTLLSSMFSILVFLFYLWARSEAESQRVFRSAIALGLCGVSALAAVFSKENAILLPLQLLLIEMYMSIRGFRSPGLMNKVTNFVVLPAALVIIGYWFHLLGAELFSAEPREYGREFTMLERVLTQSRVVGDYLYDLVIPKMQSAGVFHDGYAVSKGLFNPVSTFLWTSFHLLFISFAVIFRRRFPLASFGIFWFYLGHLIESTIIMLELKFEHRNYLASLGILMLLAAAAEEFLRSRTQQFIFAIIVGFVYTLSLLGSTSLWGRPLEASLVWVEESPESGRAWENAALKNLEYGGPVELTKKYMKKLIDVRPTAANELKYILAFCETHDGEVPDWSELAEGVRIGPRDWSLHATIADMVDQRINGNCAMAEYENILPVLNAYRENPVYRGQLTQSYIDEAEFKAALFFSDASRVREIELRYDLRLTPLQINLRRAGMLATFGYLELAYSRLSEAVEVARSGGRVTMSQLEQAEEVLRQIEKDLEDAND